MIDVKRQEEAFEKLNQCDSSMLVDKFSIKKSYSFSRDYESENTHFAHIHYGDIHSHYDGIISKATTLKHIDIPKKDYELVKESDVIIADASEDYYDLGKAIYIKSINENVQLISGLHTFLLRSKGEYDSELFYHYSKSVNYKKQMLRLGTGMSVFGISKSNLEKIILKNYKNQNTIANFLTSLDELIQKQEEYIELLKIQKNVLSLKLVGTKGKTYKIKDITQYINNDKVENTAEYDKITISLNKNGIKKLSNTSKRSDKRPFYLRKTNEIILGKQNYFSGSIAIVDEKFNNTIASNAILSFKINDHNSTKYLYEQISQKNYIAKRSALANGTGQKELSEKEFFNFEVLLPTIEEQIKIANLLDALDYKIILHNSKLEKLKLKKKYYLAIIFGRE